MITRTEAMLLEMDLADTPTSKKQDRIEKKLNRRLEKILDEINAELKTKSFFIIKQEKEKQVHDIIRFAIEDAYFQGLEYSDSALNERQPVTISDIEKIEKLTANALQRFWSLISRLEPVKEFSFNLLVTFVSTLISNVISKTINTATLANLEPIRPEDFQNVVQVMFKTREDEKVCPICEPLNNNVYDINESKPQIPDDTHPNCRCRYVVYQNGEPIIEHV